MSSRTSFSAPAAQDRAYRVEAPRASDAIAVALQDVYSSYLREASIPDDMAALLCRLNLEDLPTEH